MIALKRRIASCASWEPRIAGASHRGTLLRSSLASREPRIAGASHRGSLASRELASREPRIVHVPWEPRIAARGASHRTSHASSCVLRSKAHEPLVLPLRTEVTLPIESSKGREAADADKEPGTGAAGEQSCMMQLCLGVQYERCLLCVHQRGNGQRPRARVCRAS